MSGEGQDSSRRFVVENSVAFGVNALRGLFLAGGLLIAGFTAYALITLLGDLIGENRGQGNRGWIVLLVPLSGVILSRYFIGFGLANMYPDLVVSELGIEFEFLWQKRQIDWREMHAISHSQTRKRMLGRDHDNDLVIYSDRLPWAYGIRQSRDTNGRCIYVSASALRRDALEYELNQRQRVVVVTH
jgi:hypothetical protein